MKNLLALFMFLGLIMQSPNANAQIDPEYSDLVKKHKGCYRKQYIELDNGNVLFVRRYYELYRLTLFNEELKIIAESKIRIRDRMSYFGVRKLGEKVYFHFNLLDNSLETYMGVLKEINFPDLLLGEDIVLETIPKAVFKDEKNKNKLLIYFNFKSDTLVVETGNYATQVFKFVTFNKNLEKLDQKEVSVDDFGFEHVSVSSRGYTEEGEYYYWVSLSNDEDLREREFYLYQSDDGETRIENIEKNEPDYSGLTNMPKKVYSMTKGVGWSLMGYFTYNNQTFDECFHTYRVDWNEGEVDKEYIYCFDKDWAWGFSNEEMLGKYKKALDKGKQLPKLNFMMHSAFEFKDGSVTYFLDQDYDLSYTNKNSLSNHKDTPYHLGNIAILHYDMEGQLEWKVIIPKDQVGYWFNGRLSFETKRLDNQSVLIVFTNNNPDYKIRMSEIKAITVTPDGKLETLLSYPVPRKFISIRNGDLTGNSDKFFYMEVVDYGKEGLFRFPIQ